MNIFLLSSGIIHVSLQRPLTQLWPVLWPQDVQSNTKTAENESIKVFWVRRPVFWETALFLTDSVTNTLWMATKVSISGRLDLFMQKLHSAVHRWCLWHQRPKSFQDSRCICKAMHPLCSHYSHTTRDALLQYIRWLKLPNDMHSAWEDWVHFTALLSRTWSDQRPVEIQLLTIDLLIFFTRFYLVTKRVQLFSKLCHL